ncbi:glycosyltransferase family 4 protein [Blastomonas sp.]|uniref:glycosyltransferase family 4 protein n=1 Tax=Blastomonas sp. TaxID=1909299 RepID=UPI002629A631|nr:glycosyltransferase family 4 protein [Blastomonas sp.]MDM7957525.1 glycosyltransferase family 4 protein [Blastomonas sp.]
MRSTSDQPTIWFVNSYFHPDHSATSQILSDVAFELSASGHTVRIITGQRSYDGGSQYPASEVIDGIHVTRLPSLGPSGRGMLARLGRYLGMYLGAAWLLLIRMRRGDVVVCKTDPPLLSIPLAVVARIRGAKLVNWLQDLYPEVANSLGVGLPGTVGWLLTRLRNWSLKVAVFNIAIGECMAQLLRDQGVADNKIAILTNFVDDSHIIPLEGINPLREQWGLQGKFVIGYSGNLGRAHDIETFIEMAILLRDREDIVFLFIGGGHFVDMLRARLAEASVTNVRFESYQPREQLNLSLALPDVHWVSLLPEMEGLIVPSKIYGIMAAGRPMIAVCAPTGEMAQIIDRAQTGLQVTPGDGQGFADAVLQLADDPARLGRLGTNARKEIDANASKARVMQAWAELIARIS